MSQYQNIPFGSRARTQQGPPTSFEDAAEQYVETQATRVVSPGMPAAPAEPAGSPSGQRWRMPCEGLICPYSVVVDAAFFAMLWKFCQLLSHQASSPALNTLLSPMFQAGLAIALMVVASSWSLAQRQSLRAIEADIADERAADAAALKSLRQGMRLNDRLRNTCVVAIAAYVLVGGMPQ